MAIEEHGSGKQLARFRIDPRPSALAWALTLGFAALALAAMLNSAWTAAALLSLALRRRGAHSSRDHALGV